MYGLILTAVPNMVSLALLVWPPNRPENVCVVSNDQFGHHHQPFHTSIYIQINVNVWNAIQCQNGAHVWSLSSSQSSEWSDLECLVMTSMINADTLDQ